MFIAKTSKIETLAKEHPSVIKQLEGIFSEPTRIYIDYANVRPWSEKLGWHIDLNRLKQFMDSFTTVQSVGLYSGILKGNDKSEKDLKEAERQKYLIRTKPVKIMRLYIDTSDLKSGSVVLLKKFISPSLLRKYKTETIEYLNELFTEMNLRGEKYIEDRKCNFDVEIAVDMLLDSERNKAKTFVLWSGDSDFSDPIGQLLGTGKRVTLFATAGRVAKELNEYRNYGLTIFDISRFI